MCPSPVSRRAGGGSGRADVAAWRHAPAVVLLVLFAVGLDAGEAPAFAHVRAQDGLSHNSVYALLADRDGFIWAGTVDGLNRWDGYEVEVFRHDPGDAASLSSPIVLSLTEEGDAIWVGTSAGLDRLDRRTNHVERYGLEGMEVHALLVDRSGVLWAGTDRGLHRRTVSGVAMDAVTLSNPVLAASSVHSLVEAPDGAVMALAHTATAQFVIPFRHGRSGEPLALDPSWGYVQSLSFDAAGRLWIKPDHAAIVDVDSRTIRRNPSDAADLRVYDTAAMRDGSVWMATEAGVCRGRAVEGRVTCAPVVPGGSWLDNYARAVVAGPGGIVWVGTYGGLAWHDPHAKPFRRLAHDPANPDSIGADAVSSIVREGTALWVGTFGAGVDRVDLATGAVRHFRHEPAAARSLPDDVVWKILPDGDGNFWIGTNGGIARLDPRTGTFRTMLELPARAAVWDLAIDGRGRVWGSGASLWVCDPVAWSARRVVLDLGEPAPQNLQAIAFIDGVLWVGAGTAGLLVAVDPETETVRQFALTVDGRRLESEGIWSIRSGGDERLWLGHGRGLSRFDPETGSFEHWFPSSGLPGSVVYSVGVDDRGRPWLGTNRGLARFDESAARGSQFRVWDTSDGIASMEFNRNAAHRGAGGELYFGGIGGITTFDPLEIGDDRRVPPVALTAVEVLGASPRRAIPRGLERLTIEHDDGPVSFEFVALSYANAARSRYRYRLDGFDEGWIDAGGRRVATYTHVPSGRYVFRATGSNQDGVWNEEGVALAVTVLPPFWGTWWFRGALAMLALMALYAIHRFRMQRAIEVERLRLRIASDLHDDLASELSGMSMMAELIRRQEGLSGDAVERVEELRRKALEMADSMRDTAWGIHPEHDTTGAMIRRMRSTAEMLLSDITFTFEVRGVDSDEPMPMSERRNLHLIFKELLHNVIRHSGASAVSISLERASGSLRLNVKDDGRGLGEDATRDGDGLRNVRRRAKDIGASFDIGSDPRGGTRAVVTLG